MTFSIQNNTRWRQTVDFEAIKNAVLGKRYELSLVLMADTMARRLSKEFKGNTEHTNILSFPIDERSGEIFLNVRRAGREARGFGYTQKEHIIFLFIHGCLHLSGLEHGEEMEKEEEKFLRLFA